MSISFWILFDSFQISTWDLKILIRLIKTEPRVAFYTVFGRPLKLVKCSANEKHVFNFDKNHCTTLRLVIHLKFFVVSLLHWSHTICCFVMERVLVCRHIPVDGPAGRVVLMIIEDAITEVHVYGSRTCIHTFGKRRALVTIMVRHRVYHLQQFHVDLVGLPHGISWVCPWRPERFIPLDGSVQSTMRIDVTIEC